MVNNHIECREQIELMLERGDNNYDDSRFKYISSLYERALLHRNSVASPMLQKVKILLNRYIEDLIEVQESIQLVVRRLNLCFPDARKAFHDLEKTYNYSGLIKLEERLMRESSRSALQTLTNILIDDANSNDSQDPLSLIDQLQDQENEVVKELSDNLLKAKPRSNELRSTRLFREAQEKHKSEKIVREAIKNGPDNPGPINPHMLVIRSLSTMQSLSPQYLKRFLSYIETVFWLEEANQALKPKVMNKRSLKKKSK